MPSLRLDRVDFLPEEPSEEQAMRGTVWKSDGRKPIEREQQVRLLRYIVRRLCQPNTFVLFHVDGDRPWASRKTSENIAKFEQLTRVALPQILDRPRIPARPRRSREADTAPTTPKLPVEHLLLLSPFRSVEAWLYQNLERAIAICRREHGGQHIAALKTWETQRSEFDELPAPEKALCLGKAHNRELASQGFPARVTYEVGKSFAESVDRLKACEALCVALERTLG